VNVTFFNLQNKTNTFYYGVSLFFKPIQRHSFIHSVFCLTTGPKPPPHSAIYVVHSSSTVS